MNKSIRYMFATLALCLASLALFACVASPDATQEESVQSTIQPVLIYPEEWVQPATHIATSPQSARLPESTGPWPPSTPGLVATSIVGGATTEHGTFGTLSYTANISLTSANYAAFAAALNAASPTLAYAQVDVQYDTTSCTAGANVCPLTSWRLGVHTCSTAWQMPCPETFFVN